MISKMLEVNPCCRVGDVRSESLHLLILCHHPGEWKEAEALGTKMDATTHLGLSVAFLRERKTRVSKIRRKKIQNTKMYH